MTQAAGRWTRHARNELGVALPYNPEGKGIIDNNKPRWGGLLPSAGNPSSGPVLEISDQQTNQKMYKSSQIIVYRNCTM